MNTEDLIKHMIKAIGDDPAREGLYDTPRRVMQSWQELYSGYRQNPQTILTPVFEEGACDDIVLLRDIKFSSTCEHHMLPFTGKAHIAYLPDRKIVGISKLARVVDCFAKRLQLQEKMTQDISYAIMTHLKPQGVAVIIRAHHQCMSCRGVQKRGTTLITRSMLGVFQDKPEMRAELMMLLAQEL